MSLLLFAPGVLRAQQTGSGHSVNFSKPVNFSNDENRSTGEAAVVHVQKPVNSQAHPVSIRSDYSLEFQDGKESARLLRGQIEVRQGQQVWSAPQGVVWKAPVDANGIERLVLYLEETPDVNASLVEPGHRETRPYFVVYLDSSSGLEFHHRSNSNLPSAIKDPVALRARERRSLEQGNIQLVQNEGAPFELLVPSLPTPQSPFRRRVTIGPRFLGERIYAKAEYSEDSIQPEYVITVTGGVNIVVDNVPLTIQGQTFLSRIDLTADKAVVWTDANRTGELSGFDIDETTPFEVYLEGNITVRQGANVIQASRAYYDVNQKRGLLVDAEIRTEIAQFDGTIRLRAAELRQLNDTRFHARNAWFTTSEFGKPKYRLEASDIFMEERPSLFPNAIDPQTGQPDPSTLWIESRNNRLFIEDVPVFAAPYLTGPAEDPRIPVSEIKGGYSGVFGAELETAWSLEGIFGWNLPEGTELNLEADYFSKRGPGVGLETEFDTIFPAFGVPMRHYGEGNLYYINDHGEDNLGLGRRNLPPPNDNRGRLLWRSRSEWSPFTSLTAETGVVFNNDRNFIEQYYEDEWDQDKDLENRLILDHQINNTTASILGAIRSNNFSNQTDWFPRGDLTILGQPVFDTPVNWSSHSSIGYARLNQAESPPDPMADPFIPLDYFADSEGVVAMSRHELSLPLNAGPAKVVPYVLGEVAYWGEDLTGDDLTRWYGSAGVRGSIQFAKYMPYVRSSILGLNGLAHKVSLDADYYYAQSTADLEDIPQYNPFDEDAQERFRERFQGIEFGGVLPEVYDPRYYAVRSGAGRSVTDPYHELVDDQHAVRLSLGQRWQTKVGPPENPRTVDWMELDLGVTIFPDAAEDNFGETFGLLTGRYAWNVSARTSLLASGAFDFFDMGQQVFNVGVLSQRSERGSFYVGYRNLTAGPIESQLLTGSASYVMSPNLYVATLGASYDIAEGIDRGQTFTVTRISENFLFHFGLGYDRSRDNVGVAVSLEPKFGSYGRGSMQLNSLLGIQ
ncbi:hypothetical protein AB1L42_08145 [Thalassoglobus sp. JC818]|uniref:hypothetical protein n=1 Tax=Thalassoglobus sp. JC818 TaxID=3232136 RepID=UPI003457DA33